MDNLRVTTTTLPCRAVLFDCDGVLVDSDASVISAWRRWAGDYGLDPDQVLGMVHGRRSADTVALLVEPAVQQAAVERIDRYEIDDAAGVRAIAGAAELLAAMPPGTLAVVTSGTQALARARLAAASVPVPEVLVTADDVERGKPDPESYTAAAAQLGVSPADAIVLEDADAGIAAGRAAGVGAVVGVGGRITDGAADVVVADLSVLRWSADGLVVVRSS